MDILSTFDGSNFKRLCTEKIKENVNVTDFEFKPVNEWCSIVLLNRVTSLLPGNMEM